MESIKIQTLSNDLYKNLRDLLFEIDALGASKLADEDQSETISELKKIHNLLVFMRNSFERSFVTITGLQGSGKTTFINQLYGFESNALPENPGRGEVKPILLTERKNLEEEQAYEIRLHNDGYSLEKIAISHNDLHNKSMSPSLKTLWFEFEVPFKYTMDENKSIVLLPGFESENSNHLSQEMLQYILNMSDRAILLIRKDMTANQRNSDMIEKIQNEYSDINPLVVMSFSDINPETNSEIMNTLIEELNIKKDQLICKGSDRDAWIQEFIEKVDSFNDGNAGLLKRKHQQLETISKEIRKNINEVNLWINEDIKNKELETLLKDMRKDRTLISLQTKNKKVLDDIQKQLKNDLNPVKQNAKQEYKKYVNESETKMKSLKSFFNSDALENSMIYEEKIKDIWASNIKVQNIEKKLHVNSTSAIIQLENQYFGAIQSDSGKHSTLISFSSLNKDTMDSSDILDEETFDENNIYINHLDHINNYFDWNEVAPIELNDKDLATLTIMGTALARQMISSSELIETSNQQYNEFGHKSGNLDEFKDIEKVADQTKKKINSFELNAISNIFLTRSVLKGIPVVLGVDAAVDGNMTLLGNASAALETVGISISAKALLGWIGAGLITLKTIETLHLQTVKLNAKKVDLAQKGEELFDVVTEDYIEGIMNIYKDIFKTIEQRYIDLQHKRTSNDPDYNSMKRIVYISNELKSNAQSFAKEVKNEKLLFESNR
ncbi:dynamin family protein [Salisediminibacterium beveridgei]|uniref:Sugar Kinase n=1 Tax=Salisediminibacterium beveridgei TaxID=632773 RepID=A0A1D7QZM4_9BACI|nr:dynamin family protein [Salisediminibacterium beveridgei]AOM84455.1 Sugar Kinase [Salisediminibacterium beveridgei]